MGRQPKHPTNRGELRLNVGHARLQPAHGNHTPARCSHGTSGGATPFTILSPSPSPTLCSCAFGKTAQRLKKKNAAACESDEATLAEVLLAGAQGRGHQHAEPPQRVRCRPVFLLPRRPLAAVHGGVVLLARRPLAGVILARLLHQTGLRAHCARDNQGLRRHIKNTFSVSHLDHNKTEDKEQIPQGRNPWSQRRE